jgi:hypothetical protein
MTYKTLMLCSTLSFTMYELKKLVQVQMLASDLSEYIAVVTFSWFYTIAPGK